MNVIEGRILGIIGPNGAGKSTALNAILGLTDYQGELKVLGRDPWTERDQLTRAVCGLRWIFGILNRHPFPDVVHGCLLEGMTLAIERRFEPFSQGRGFTTRQRVEEMEAMAVRHGNYLAPFCNAAGLVPKTGTVAPLPRFSARSGGYLKMLLSGYCRVVKMGSE